MTQSYLSSLYIEEASLVAVRPDGMVDEEWEALSLQLVEQGFLASRTDFRSSLRDATRFVDVLRDSTVGQVEWNMTSAAAETVRARRKLTDDLARVLHTSIESQQQWPGDLDEPSQFGFRRTLTEPQRGDVARLLYMGHGGNFSVPGSGKTTVAYCVWAAERARDEVDALLVVCPVSAFEAWQEEATQCFAVKVRPSVHVMPGPVPHDADVVVLSYPRLARNRDLAELDGWLSTRRVMLVFDESHRVKAGPAGVWGSAAIWLAGRCARRYVMSGTPMPNSLDDISVQLGLCWPGYGAEFASGALARDRQKIFVRTTKDQLHLPELVTRVERVPLDRDHRQVYDSLAGHAMDLLTDRALAASVKDIGAALMRLIVSATNPAAILDVGRELQVPTTVGGIPLDEVVRNAAAVLRPAKLVRAAQLVEQNVALGRKTLVWSAFVANVKAVAELLAVYQPAVITGRTPVEDERATSDRVRELRRFRNDPDCKVLVATPQTMGEGISLHRTCTDQIHLDRTFNAGIYLQSLDRTHRLGMAADAKPTVTVLLAEDTIDLVVHESLSTKITRMSNVLQDPTLARMQLPDFDESLSLGDLLLDGISSAQELRSLLMRVRGA
ncbi:DEAD/DEAH box helicase [Crossiella sp. NPDC003009]